MNRFNKNLRKYLHWSSFGISHRVAELHFALLTLVVALSIRILLRSSTIALYWY